MSNVFVSLPNVKINNSYDYYRTVDPTASEKEPAYTNGQTWLNTVSGESFQLTDQVAGTWAQIEIDIDEKINNYLDSVCDSVLEYLNEKFIVDRNINYFDEDNNSFDAEFPTDTPGPITRKEAFTLVNTESVYSNFTFNNSAKTITVTTGAELFGSITDSFKATDIIYVGSSRRNDGYYTIASVTSTSFTISEDTLKDGSANCFIFLVDIPAGLTAIMGRMIWYDVYKRSTVSGLQSETVGTYSWTKAPFTNGMRYPDDIISGLDNYRNISIGGVSSFVN